MGKLHSWKLSWWSATFLGLCVPIIFGCRRYTTFFCLLCFLAWKRSWLRRLSCCFLSSASSWETGNGKDGNEYDLPLAHRVVPKGGCFLWSEGRKLSIYDEKCWLLSGAWQRPFLCAGWPPVPRLWVRRPQSGSCLFIVCRRTIRWCPSVLTLREVTLECDSFRPKWFM